MLKKVTFASLWNSVLSNYMQNRDLTRLLGLNLKARSHSPCFANVLSRDCKRQQEI